MNKNNLHIFNPAVCGIQREADLILIEVTQLCFCYIITVAIWSVQGENVNPRWALIDRLIMLQVLKWDLLHEQPFFHGVIRYGNVNKLRNSNGFWLLFPFYFFKKNRILWVNNVSIHLRGPGNLMLRYSDPIITLKNRAIYRIINKQYI